MNQGENHDWHSANGKVILFGEHAVVYGVSAIAGGIPNAMRARVTDKPAGRSLSIANWGMSVDLERASPENSLVQQTISYLLEQLQLQQKNFHLELEPGIPHASGLGASAAVAVASVRALSSFFALELGSEQINSLAFGCEKIAHGSPSGLDNTLSTYGGLLKYKRTAAGAQFEPIECEKAISLVVAISGKRGFTAQTVKRVAEARAQRPEKYDKLFKKIDLLSQQAESAIAKGDFDTLASLMTLNQDCLREMGVSCTELEKLIACALDAGACGAKLTGSGDGGAAIIYAGEQQQRVKAALTAAGFKNFSVSLGPVKEAQCCE